MNVSDNIFAQFSDGVPEIEIDSWLPNPRWSPVVFIASNEGSSFLFANDIGVC